MIRRQYHQLLQTIEDKGYYRLRTLLAGIGFVLWAVNRLMEAGAMVFLGVIVTSGIEVYVLRSVLETAILNNTMPDTSIADAGPVDWFFGICVTFIGRVDYLDWLLLAGDNLALGLVYGLFFNRVNPLAGLLFLIALATDKLLMFILWNEGVFSAFHEVISKALTLL